MNDFTITEWETIDGRVYGHDDAGNCLIEIAPRDDRSPAREWFVNDEIGTEFARGEAKDLRAAKKEAVAALKRVSA